jgi:uncharacterized membrane protein YccC
MRSGAATRPSWGYVAEVARSLLGVLVAVAAALHWGSPAAAVAVGGSSAIAGAVALQDSRHGRMPLVLGVTGGMGLAVLIGWLAAPHSVGFVVTVVIWSAAAGMLWAVSANAGMVAAAATVLLLTAPTAEATPPGAVATALLVLGGGLLQVILVAAWPAQRWQRQRAALARAYRGLAIDARLLAADPAAPIDIDPLIALRESYTLTERQARRRPPAFRGLYALPERISLTFDALRAAAAAPGVQDALAAASDVLAAIAEDGRTGYTRAQTALSRLADAVTIVPVSASEAAARLQAQLQEATTLHFGDGGVPMGTGSKLRGPGLWATVRGVRDEIAAELNLDSPILRHAVRLALAVAVGTALTRLAGLGYGYWVALTVVLVLRPETAHTYTRCLSRVVGTAAGIAAATVLTTFWHPGAVLAALLAVLCVGAAYGVAGLGYVPLSAALAASIVFLLAVGGYAETPTAGSRLLGTLIGGLLAVAAHAALPDQSLIRLRQRAGELMKAEIDYAAVVIRSFVHQLATPDAALSSAWQRALRARSAFEAASGSARADAASVRRWLTSYRAALNSVTGVCTTLERQMPGTPPLTLDRRFVVAVDDYVDALRGDAPRPGQAWRIDVTHLLEAAAALRESAALLGKEHSAQRVMAVEVDNITRQLVGASQQA